MHTPIKRWLTIGASILAAVLLVVGFSNGAFPSYLPSNVISPSSDHPKIVTGHLSFRATPDQARKLHAALENLADPPRPSFNPSDPGPSDAPASTGTAINRRNKERVAAAKKAVPGLQNIALQDINPLYPSLVSKTKINEPAFRWFTVDLPENPQIIEVTDDGTSSFDFKPISSRHTKAVQRLKQTAAQIKQAGVEFVEPEPVAELAAVPNDPYYHSSNSWGQELDDLWWLKKINIEEAWNVTTGSRDVVIAVIDSGLDLSHPDIAGNLDQPETSNIWQNQGELGRDASGHDKRTNGKDDDLNGFVDDWIGYDFYQFWDDLVDNDPEDFDIHGTAVSGVAAALGNNDRDITGVMWQGKIMAVKAEVEGNSAILYAVLNGADIINMSYGVDKAGPGASQAFTDTIRYAHNQGALLISAAGNTGKYDDYQSYPSSFPEVISVAATTPDDARAPFSTFASTVELAAPGTDILLLESDSHSKDWVSDFRVGPGLLQNSGTSLSSPMVAGLAGLILSAHPDWTAEEVRSTLRATADDIDTPGFDERTGFGRINARKALSATRPFPAAYITTPIRGTTVSYDGRALAIRGTAGGRTFKGYTLEVGKGKNPTAWSASGVS
ncbi:MAG: S8 family serine peptidase, partial [Planctomycetales bacterium]|nr:S8 family serine peptidase [Planctomycetales bacterium]